MSYIYNLLKQFLAFLLNTTDKYVGNFGISIIIVTILIKILLLPLTLKQDKSMKEMKKLQPELEKIKKDYAHDKQMLNIKTMELYREHKVNPLGGCLPILIQLPILFALFGVLRSGIIPTDSSFLWMKLSEPDPFFILPVLNGAVSFLQQKLMGTSDNAQMKNMMYVFPIMMIVISYKMPSGLQLYWLTSSLIAVIQQYFIMKKVLILLIRFYQKFISPMFPAKCRFYPTCSQYTLEAVKEHGAIKGTYLGIKRILKCHPFHEGGYDPVPKKENKNSEGKKEE